MKEFWINVYKWPNGMTYQSLMYYSKFEAENYRSMFSKLLYRIHVRIK